MFKKYLGSSLENFESSSEKIHPLLELQYTEIKASLEKKFHIFQHTFNPTVYANLRGIISIAALNIVLNELNRVNSVGIDISLCDSDVRCTHGLPCIHDIAEYIKEG